MNSQFTKECFPSIYSANVKNSTEPSKTNVKAGKHEWEVAKESEKVAISDQKLEHYNRTKMSLSSVQTFLAIIGIA